MPPRADIAGNLQLVRRRIDAAARRAGRAPSDIQLVAVSKTFDAEAVRAAASAGQRIFGENRVQEGLAKIEALGDLSLQWHLIGHLQTNKSRKAAAAFTSIDSIDSLDLLERVDAAAVEAATRPDVLIQVDLAHEPTKHGVPVPLVAALAAAAVRCRAVSLRGLMTVPPIPGTPEDSRPWFRRLRLLRDDLRTQGIPAERLTHLSMGMSQDFEVAIEEGATMVRVGTAVFGWRAAAV